jgi:hypothetical protein
LTDDRSLGIFINMQGGASNQGLAALDRAGYVSRFFLGLALLIAAPGCAVNSYMGIPLVRSTADAGLQAGAAEPSLQLLAARARAGDKQAELDLAERFELGRGVTRDLKRAQQLYASAARDSKKRMSLYIATPGGRTASIQREFAETRFDGLTEAKVRLYAIGQPDAESPRVDQQDFEIGDRDVVREKGVLLYGYQPIFNGLKSSQGDWREGIMAEGAAFPITEESLNETLLFLALSPALPETANAVAGIGEVRAYCSAAVTGSIAGRAEMRRAALCIARFPDLAAGVADRLGATLLADMPSGEVPTTSDNALLAQELIFLYRALHYSNCGSPALQKAILAAVARLVPPFAAQERSCRIANCPPRFDNAAFRAYAVAATSLVEAVMEAPDLVRDPHVKEVITGAADYILRRTVLPSAASLSDELKSFCVEAELEYAVCRKQFRRNPRLLGALGGSLATYLTDRFQGGRGCGQLRARTRELEPELQWEPDLRLLSNNATQSFCSGE